MGKREYFPAYFSLKRRMRRLTTQEIGEVFLAALEYAETGIETDLEGNAAVAFDFIKEDIDRSNSSYADLCADRKAYGSKGGRPKKEKTMSFSENHMVSEKPYGFDEEEENHEVISETLLRAG